MAKEKGFANFTPEQAADYRQGQQQSQPQEPYTGKDQNKKKQKQKDH